MPPLLWGIVADVVVVVNAQDPFPIVVAGRELHYRYRKKKTNLELEETMLTPFYFFSTPKLSASVPFSMFQVQPRIVSFPWQLAIRMAPCLEAKDLSTSKVSANFYCGPQIVAGARGISLPSNLWNEPSPRSPPCHG